MKKAIKKELTNRFNIKFKREPDKDELKRLDYLAFQYSRDLKYILKMEMIDFKLYEKREEKETEKEDKIAENE